MFPVRTARIEAASAKKLAAAGVDPPEERRKVTKVVPTFDQVAKEGHAEMVKGRKNGKHTRQWIKPLELYAYRKADEMGVEHAVPLSRQAADAFRRARSLRIAGSDVVFPGGVTGAPCPT